MVTRTRIAILFVGLALAIGGCANGSSSGSAGSGPTPTATNTSGCPMALTIAAADANKTVCVAVGGTVTINLSDGTRWQPIDVTGNALTQKGTPPSPGPGGQSATLDATSVGTAQITSAHAACPSSPGRISCHAIIAWHVTVDIKS